MKTFSGLIVLLALAGCATAPVSETVPAAPAPAEARAPVRVVISASGGLFADFGSPQKGDVEVKASGPYWGTVTVKVGSALAADGSVVAERTEVFSYTGAEEDTFVMCGAEGVRYVQAECTMLSDLKPGSILMR